jgi:hypothetical protein
MTHAVVLLFVAAAPVPPAKPGLSADHEALLRAVEADMREADALGDEVAELRRGLFRAAAVKLDRLHAALAGRSNGAKRRVARAAARAWTWGAESGRALPYYEQAARLAATWAERVDALSFAADCLSRLGRDKEAERYMDLVRNGP